MHTYIIQHASDIYGRRASCRVRAIATAVNDHILAAEEPSSPPSSVPMITPDLDLEFRLAWKYFKYAGKL